MTGKGEGRLPMFGKTSVAEQLRISHLTHKQNHRRGTKSMLPVYIHYMKPLGMAIYRCST